MNKKNLRKVVSTFIVGIILGVSTMSVLAGVAEGAWGYYGPVQGYSYKNIARVYVSETSGWTYAQSYVEKDGSGIIPTGYMGAQARLYKNDALEKTAALVYNTADVTSLSSATTASYQGGAGTYYSKGITLAFNGSGYDTYTTFQSPNQIY